MSMSRMFALPVAIFVATIATLPIGANAATLALVGSSTKVCQLIGDKDWATNNPTAAQTLSNFGLDAVDLGFPVDSGAGPLFFLFGDALPVLHQPSTVPPDDAFGFTFRTAPPDSTACLGLQLVLAAPKIFGHPAVFPPIQQGSFNVPSGGVSFDGKFYAFFWTNHCMVPGNLTPEPNAPLSLPPANADCAELAENNSVGRSVVAQATALNPLDPLDFYRTIPRRIPDPLRRMPSGFVYVSAAQPASASQPDIPVFGVARYRASIPYLAMAPRKTFGDPQTWSFFAGRVSGHPVWVTRAQWESGHNFAGEWTPPSEAEIYPAQPAGERCVGEHSATWDAPLHTWLLLYNCARSIEARFAPEPSGPWSPPLVILDVQNPAYTCTLLQNKSASGCPGLRNYWMQGSDTFPGFFYAPFVMDRFTQDATLPGPGQPKRATIYWLVSTWNPYTVVVMQSTLELK
jgi:Domain of unknown function (DUF4185)